MAARHLRAAGHWGVLSRTAAAVLGGYALANLGGVALASAWPMARAEATMAALQLSFALHTAAVVWAFAARSAWRAWLGLALPTALCGLTVAALR
jgi:hypothetical protein